MTFEWYNPKKDILRVSITNNAITFYKEVIDAMGSPEYILLGFNVDKKIIAVKVCGNDNENKIEFKSKRNNSYIRIFDKKFIRFIETKISENQIKKRNTKTYLASWNDDDQMLYIDLDKLVV
jgi:hypothetical protein